MQSVSCQFRYCTALPCISVIRRKISFLIQEKLKSPSNDKILNYSKLKALADDIIIVTQNLKLALKRAKKVNGIMPREKGLNAFAKPMI